MKLYPSLNKTNPKCYKLTYLLSFNIIIVLNFENVAKAETKRDVKKQVIKQMIIKRN